jgi:hypothetical protein
MMFVVEADGIAVGMNRVRFLEDGSAWFEGARVRPEFRGMGLATMLGEKTMQVARDRGVRVFRLVSGSRNRLAHRQIARMGFREASRMSVYVPGKGARSSPAKEAALATPGDLAKAIEIVRGSREFRLGSGVYWDSFAAKSLSPRMLEELVRRRQVWLAGRSVAIANVGGEGGWAWKQVCFLAGREDECVRLVRHVFGLKTKSRASRRFAYVPQGSRIIGALRKAGFERWSSLILFERPPAKG